MTRFTTPSARTSRRRCAAVKSGPEPPRSGLDETPPPAVDGSTGHLFRRRERQSSSTVSSGS
jgi:hypothetical protein